MKWKGSARPDDECSLFMHLICEFTVHWVIIESSSNRGKLEIHQQKKMASKILAFKRLSLELRVRGTSTICRYLDPLQKKELRSAAYLTTLCGKWATYSRSVQYHLYRTYSSKQYLYLTNNQSRTRKIGLRTIQRSPDRSHSSLCSDLTRTHEVIQK